MSNKNSHLAIISQIKQWSPAWFIPAVAVFIGSWILFYHLSYQGPQVILVTSGAEGIEAGKTAIKSRSVDIGVVQEVILTDDLQHVKIKARLHAGMEKLLHQDSVFWVVKPQIGREGVSGLGTLLSGYYIEMQPGLQGNKRQTYPLLEQAPLASPDAQGVRIILNSEKAEQLDPGAPVLFRGYRVGSVETGTFDTEKRAMYYQLFIVAPYDRLVTKNVRFWKESGIAVDMSATGVRLEMGSLSTILSGGVSFDVPEGWEVGTPATDQTAYHLFDNKLSIEDSLYEDYIEYLLFFNDSIRGLGVGAPVEFRGIRLGTVAKAPYNIPGWHQTLNKDYRIPVLIRIEPGRLSHLIGNKGDIQKALKEGKTQGLRASLKIGNLFSSSLYVDLDFYTHPSVSTEKIPAKVAGLSTIPTESSNFSQIQQKLVATLDTINALPFKSLLTEATNTLKESRQGFHSLKNTIEHLDNVIASPSMQQLPIEMQRTLNELRRGLRGIQPGSPAYNKLVDDMHRLDVTLRDLQPLLKTLNNKSNALIFEAKPAKDPEPKRANR